ncbi:MAG: dTDP-4-dehydrorhamnose reductase [Microvirga sp.]
MILLFGAGGQLGQELACAARERSIPIRAFDRSQADISDASAVTKAITETKASLVVNAAAYTAVDKAETAVDEAKRANETGPAILAEACARSRLPLVHISTDYVFDGSKTGPYVETDPVSPLGVYGRTKAAGEEAIRIRHAEHLILRTSWVFGRFGRNLLKTAVKLAAERDDLRFVADQRGCPTSTADLAEAILRIAPRVAAEPLWGTYHLAGTGATTWFEFVRHIVAAQSKFTGRYPRVHPIATSDYPTPARRPANSELASTLFEITFGFKAQHWQDRVDSTVAALVHDRSLVA